MKKISIIIAIILTLALVSFAAQEGRGGRGQRGQRGQRAHRGQRGPIVKWEVTIKSLKANVEKVFTVDARQAFGALRKAYRQARKTWAEAKGGKLAIMMLKRVVPVSQAPTPETENIVTETPDTGPAQDE
jgi:hypothetical protein